MLPLALLTTTVLLASIAALPGSGPLVAGVAPGSTGAVPTATSAGVEGLGATAPPAARAPAGSSCSGPCSTSQTVAVTILPGPLTISVAPGPVSVHTNDAGVGTSRLSETRVTDLRGAAPGWTLSARLVSVLDAAGAAVAGVSVEATPTCTRTAGPLTLESADTSLVKVGQVAALCVVPIASAGSLAGGLVTATAEVTLRGAPADTLVLLGFATSLA